MNGMEGIHINTVLTVCDEQGRPLYQIPIKPLEDAVYSAVCLASPDLQDVEDAVYRGVKRALLEISQPQERKYELDKMTVDAAITRISRQIDTDLLLRWEGQETNRAGGERTVIVEAIRYRLQELSGVAG